jgi:aryl-alcohol dehydrogenase-like predicted oxidoreductase
MKPDATHRRLGRTDQVSFIVGLGGISLKDVETAGAARFLNEAIDAGVNHFDVAPTYFDAQAKMGQVLRLRRNELFLSCKTNRRDAAGARAGFAESLRLLQTDHIDLFQFHGVDHPEELDQITTRGGALEFFLEARKAGVIRYIGVTSHKPDVLTKALERIELDTMLAPINFRTVDRLCGPAGVIAKARAKGLGVIAIKATTRGEIKPTEDAYRYTLSQDVDITMPAGGEFLAACEIGRRFKPMSATEQQKFLEHCRATYELARTY